MVNKVEQQKKRFGICISTSIDLMSRRTQRALSIEGILWPCILNGAVETGWQPAGTEKPESYAHNDDGQERCLGGDKGWSGGYLSNDCQIVGDEDARNLGLALERMLPSQDLDRELMRALIAICRDGAFIIG